MESSPDPASSDAGNSVSKPATPVMDTPANLETLQTDDHHQTPVRGQSRSGSNKGK